MRADRLLSLLLLLQNRGRMTAPELATELDVSVRTVYRDIEALSGSGVPVHADRGPAGGFRLMAGYRTRLTGLTGSEADSLFLSGLPGPVRELGLGAVLATAQLKVRAALPAPLAEHSRLVQDRFHLDAPAWFRDPDPVPFLPMVARAVWEQRVLRVRYRRWRGEARRALRPLGIVLKGGIWYAVAVTAASDGERGDAATAGTEAATGAEPAGSRSPAGGTADGGGTPAGDVRTAPTRPDSPPRGGTPAGEVRTYRISRLLEAALGDEVFERPAGFDLAAVWEASARRLEELLRRETARVRLSPAGLRLLPAKFGAPGERAREQAGPPDADGWTEVELAVESQPVAVSDLLGLGAEAEVVGPPALRAAMVDAVQALAARYPSGA
ncbi:helix-turn-helix transcriptional regulator [Streptomyces qinglanensis]|uniref:helix-turn-helix transcriptional regulator n=1 Tax=Streptomyces qinglanensis TaxID=943816 RepID=UPI00379DC091